MSKKYTSIAGVGVAADMNAHWRRSMEDAHVIVDNYGGVPTSGFFAVYDGHGGRDAVEVVAARLHESFLEELRKQGDGGSVEQAFKDAYLSTDSILERENILYTGTTSVTCYLRMEGDKKVLYTANAGDSRAVLCRGDSALRLTYDHKASDKEEQERVAQDGGWIALNRVNGVLAITRALGDHAMKPAVTAIPYQTRTVIGPEDKFLIVACDGVCSFSLTAAHVLY
mmetsp:Transcript_2381/g.4932  ORF Transcript_2381/g.4932 Transcript_2381/m.4932 type:complete len:226 (-) Transcript_2381:64-741(-)